MGGPVTNEDARQLLNILHDAGEYIPPWAFDNPGPWFSGWATAIYEGEMPDYMQEGGRLEDLEYLKPGYWHTTGTWGEGSEEDD